VTRVRVFGAMVVPDMVVAAIVDALFVVAATVESDVTVEVIVEPSSAVPEMTSEAIIVVAETVVAGMV
jgi:hypothetical protein